MDILNAGSEKAASCCLVVEGTIYLFMEALFNFPHLPVPGISLCWHVKEIKCNVNFEGNKCLPSQHQRNTGNAFNFCENGEGCLFNQKPDGAG